MRVKCDKCGKKVDDSKIKSLALLPVVNSEHDDEFDLCAGCYKAFKRWLKSA